MMAITRLASMTPSSMSFASSDASATEWIGTLRTSMASGTVDDLSLQWFSARGTRLVFSGSAVLDDGSDPALDGVGDAGQVGDDGPAAAGAHEPQGRLDLGPHRARREVTG